MALRSSDLPNPFISFDFQRKWVQPVFKFIDLANAVILVIVLLFLIVSFVPKLAVMFYFEFVQVFLFCSIPGAPSMPNHYVDKVGGYHQI